MIADIATAETVDDAELADLYASVGWVAYTHDPQGLAAAVRNSSHVVTARIGDELVGLARCVSDEVSIFYLQDILVRPEHQRRGIGRAMLAECLDRYRHVRQKVLLTGDDAVQHSFYESAGYRDTRLISSVGLRAFVRIEGLDLETGTPEAAST
jgi:GNAT superfamily N-acetyltransferase